MRGKNTRSMWLIAVLALLCSCGTAQSVSENEAAAPLESEAVAVTPTPAPTPAAKPYVTACGELNGNYEAIYAKTEAEREIGELISLPLFDISEHSKKTVSDGVAYEFTLDEDICFSDGTPVTARDLIFTVYVLSDPAYRGGNAFYTLPIKGMDEYRIGSRSLLELLLAAGEDNTRFGYFTEEQQKTFFEKDLPQAGADFANDIAEYCVENGMMSGIEAIDANPVANAMLMWGYGILSPDGSVTGLHSGTVWTMQSAAVPSAGDFYREMLLAYKGDYEKLSASEMANKELFDFLPEEYHHTIGAGVSSAALAGVSMSGEYSIKLTLSEDDEDAEEFLNIPVLPLHYYGDTEYFEPEKNRFGFHKGDLSAMEALSSMPMGAGSYMLTEADEDSVRLEKNPYYHGDAADKEVLVYKYIPVEQRLAAIEAGMVNEAKLPATKELLASLPEGAELSLTPVAAYDYIGFSAERFAVSGNSATEESKALRKAIATVMSVYRSGAIEAYYGEAALKIEYPVAADGRERIAAADAREAFSVDAGGGALYTEDMTQKEREAAALAAALEYFEAAGYTIEDGMLIAAPKGAKLSYELLLVGGGIGDEPSYEIVKNAAESLAAVGFSLDIRDISDPAALDYALEGGAAEIWCGSWEEGTIPPLKDYYFSECRNANMHRIFDDDIDALIRAEDAETDPDKKDGIYREFLAALMDHAVVLPVAQRQEAKLTIKTE